MFVERYLFTPLEYRKFLGDDNYLNSPSYADPIIIKGRIEDSQKFKTKENHLEFVSSFKYIVLEKVQPRDMLNGSLVISSYPIYKFNGEISHYEVQTGETAEL